MNDLVEFKNDTQLFIENWLNGLPALTRKNYSYLMSDLFRSGLLYPCSLEQFSKLNFEIIVDKIKMSPGMSESAKQNRAKAFISFTRHLNRITNGKIRIAVAKRGANATFRAIREKAATGTISESDWKKFIAELEKSSKRDAIVAKCLLQGAKRASEALNLKVSDVDFEKNCIRFTQLKTNSMIKIIPVDFPPEFMQEIKEYIESSENYRDENQWLFVSRKKLKLSRAMLGLSFQEASARAGIGHVHPHMLRTTWVTRALTAGTEPLDMMIVTGHTGLNMISYYDKRAIEDNVTKKLRMF